MATATEMDQLITAALRALPPNATREAAYQAVDATEPKKGGSHAKKVWQRRRLVWLDAWGRGVRFGQPTAKV